MIDVWGVVASSLWILGLALGLATASFAYWAASIRKVAGLDSMCSRNVRISLDGAGVLFTVGWSASAGGNWERLIWGLLAVFMAIQLWWDWKGSRP